MQLIRIILVASFNHRFVKYTIITTVFFILFTTMGWGQQKKIVKLKPIKEKSSFHALVKLDTLQTMVELKRLIHNVQYELRYASKHNFTRKRLYPRNTNTTYLRLNPALALAKVAEDLKEKGLGIKIWDAYRPYRTTVRFWELIHDERFVANPSKGSGHNRGTSVDLTLVDLRTGKELAMPTPFDDFSPAAFHGATNIDDVRIRNRLLLRTTMEKFGFVALETEWWHYSWPGASAYEVLDLSFTALRSMIQ
jgi:D-alanyl-D-alanine dipeptidase